MITTSIIIPVFNKWNFTKSCLTDLSRLNHTKHEIIIVDNGSSDETKSLNSIFNFPFYIRNEENLGFAKACNIGYSIAKGESIIFLNNDIRVKSHHNDWTSLITESLDKNNIVGPSGGMVDTKNNFQFLYETNDKNKKINYISGWCISAKKNVFDKLIINDYSGPFSEEFGLAYFEDTDLSFRANSLGIEFKLVDIPVIHFGRITSNQINTHKLYSEARNIFINKWK